MDKQSLADELKGFGGLLRCNTCGFERGLGDISNKLNNGWPKCCGYTMTWLTDKCLKEEQGRE